MLTFIGCVWAIVVFGGCAAVGADGEDDPAVYAKIVFWPLFGVIYLLKGLFKALWTIND